MDSSSGATAAEYAAQCFINRINEVILFPLITLLLALAFLVFLYGAFEYVRDAQSEQGRAQGKQHLLYGTIGMLVMLSAYAILSLAAGTFGIGLFDADRISCDAEPVATGAATAPTMGMDMGNFGVGSLSSDGAFIPGGETAPAVSLPPMLASPDAVIVDTLPVADTSTPPCPAGQSRIDGMCTVMYPFEIRNDDQIEVSCIGDVTCIGAINACTTHYDGVYSSVQGDGYIICNDSNFSSGPVSTVVYSNPPEGMFTPPAELSAPAVNLDTPPEVDSFSDSVRFSGTNTFVSPEFEENFDAYVAPYVVEDNADEQALLNTYAEFGVTTVLFMVPEIQTQQGSTLSQVEGRCEDLGGELALESGSSQVTRVATYACLR